MGMVSRVLPEPEQKDIWIICLRIPQKKDNYSQWQTAVVVLL